MWGNDFGIGRATSRMLDFARRHAKQEDPLELPSRNDVVMGVLNQQLDTLKRRRSQGQVLGGNTQSQDTSALASSTLFGV